MDSIIDIKDNYININHSDIQSDDEFYESDKCINDQVNEQVNDKVNDKVNDQVTNFSCWPYSLTYFNNLFYYSHNLYNKIDNNIDLHYGSIHCDSKINIEINKKLKKLKNKKNKLNKKLTKIDEEINKLEKVKSTFILNDIADDLKYYFLIN
jgi:hypothetical protein